MARKSAKYIAQDLVGHTALSVYTIWEAMGVVARDKFGDWAITEYGRSIGGKISKSNHSPVPTFDADKIIDMMIDFCKKNQE